MRIHATVATAIALAFHTTTPCQGPSQDLLPEGTMVVAHFDTQKCLGAIGKELIQAQLRRHGDDKLRGALASAARKWDFNPLRDIVGVTVFGNPLAEGAEPSVMLWTNDRLDKMVDEQLRNFTDEVVEQNMPRELASVDRSVMYLNAVASALTLIKLSPREFDLSVRIVTPYDD